MISPRPATQHPRKDASMDLLTDILRSPVEPDYARVAASGSPKKSNRLLILGVALLIGTMFAVSAVRTSRSAPAIEVERQQLITQIEAEESRLDGLRARAQGLRQETDVLRDELLGGDTTAEATRAELARLETWGGDVPVIGPGVVVVVDDAPTGLNNVENRVLDRDLQLLANGLWQAGAEAIAINGHRLTTLTAIRGAGSAITVDYRSLTRPYRIEAIGSPRSLAARFAETPGGRQWQSLRENYQLRFEMNQTDGLRLAADPGLQLKWARRAR